MIRQVLLTMLAGWSNRYQQQIITQLQETNRILKAQLYADVCVPPLQNIAVLLRSPSEA